MGEAGKRITSFSSGYVRCRTVLHCVRQQGLHDPYYGTRVSVSNRAGLGEYYTLLLSFPPRDTRIRLC